MMGIPPSEAKALTWWEYNAIVSEWSERHKPADAPDDTPPPDADKIEALWRRHEAMGLVTRMH